VRLAEEAGLSAEGRVAAATGTTAAAILATADEIDAAMLLLGCRGLLGARSFLLGSVAHDVAQRATRPLLVIPSAAGDGAHDLP